MTTESTLYLVRHGQTAFNLQDRLGGDSELTEEGIRQARRLALYLSRFKIDRIYCSTLKRSIQTARIIQEYQPKARFIQRADLVEISSGSLDSFTYTEFEKKIPEAFEARRRDKYHWAFPGGESYASALERVRPFLAYLSAEPGLSMVVGHQGINRVILGALLELTQNEIPFLDTPNDVLFEINLKNPAELYHIRGGNRQPGLFRGPVQEKKKI